MTNEPKVTGLSPMTGPPGTKITVRGENLGKSREDIIRLTVNGSDCLPYLEWISSQKVITRCTKTIGIGDIIITTNSSGVGTCDVQFDCCEEIVGPTKESAVWVEEIDYQLSEKEKMTIPGTNEEYSIDISSSQFNPQIYLLHNHSNADLGELGALRTMLLGKKIGTRATNSSANRAILLKSNLPVIMKCLQLLESKYIIESKEISVDNIIGSIQQSLLETHKLFDPLLTQRDLVQSIESAMQIFKQNETLFNLPSAIETSIKSKSYDSVVKEISGVLSRLKTIDIDQTLLEKIQLDVTSKVDKLRQTIENQIHQSCKCSESERNIDEVKKLISHLNRLGTPVNYDIWVAIKKMSKSLVDTLSEQYDRYLKLSREAEIKNNEPYVVQFVRSAMKIFHNNYYDILSLGQAYFDPKDEFTCREQDDLKQNRMIEFNENMISDPIEHLCDLLRVALIHDSRKLKEPSPWPSNENQLYVNCLREILQSVKTCYIHLTKVNLPPLNSALKYFESFVAELKKSTMNIIFGNATRINKNLHLQEDWVGEVDDLYGGKTKLPLIFEENVVQVLRFSNEIIFKTSLPDEKSILAEYQNLAELRDLAHKLINSFLESLDKALTDSQEHLAETARILFAVRDSDRAPSKYTNRILVTMCNCQFTKDVVFVKFQDEFEKFQVQGLKMDDIFEKCSRKYAEHIQKLSDKFCKIKRKELGEINNEVNLQIDLMIINSQIFLLSPQFVDSLMTTIVNSIAIGKRAVR